MVEALQRSSSLLEEEKKLCARSVILSHMGESERGVSDREGN